MAIFKYTLPSGSNYVVEAPAGTTQAQADYVFYSQVAAGSLVGYSKGQTLSSTSTQLAKFELSRLDRQTAGVDTLAILSIISGLPVTAFTPSLLNVPLQRPITVADFASVNLPLGYPSIGPMTPGETQGTTTAGNVFIPQDGNTVSTGTGVGQYGFSPSSLEQTGYLKPGTSNYPDYNCVVGTPSVWTGKNGITSLAGILGDSETQTQIQLEIMQNSYNALTAGGTIKLAPSAPAALSTGVVYTASGFTSLTPAILATGTAALTTNLDGIVKTAFASSGNISSLLTKPVENISTIASGAVNTVTQGIASLSGQTTALLSQTTAAAISSATTTATAAAKAAVNGSVGALVNNATTFGAPLAAAWASGGSSLSAGLASISSGASGIVTGAVGQATGIVNGVLSTAQGFATNTLAGVNQIAGQLTALGTQGQALLGSLGSSLDAFGKLSSFSVDFSAFSSDSLVSATKVAAGYVNTVSRQTVDAAVTRILGDAKIPVPSFEFPSALTDEITADLEAARQKLKELGQQIVA